MTTVVLCRRADNAPDAPWVLVYNSAENMSFDWVQEHGYHYQYFASLEDAQKFTGPIRITVAAYLEFVKSFAAQAAQNPTYRFGQAFVNEMLPDGIWDPELFNLGNRANRSKSEELIMSRYIQVE